MLREETGAGAVSLSQRLADLKEARVEPQDAADELRLVAGRAFLRVGGVWIDQALSKQHQVLAVRYGSAAYFRLVEMRPDLAKCLALGDQLIVVLSDTLAIRVGDAGLETLSDADAARLKP
jgi:hypothetical protein